MAGPECATPFVQPVGKAEHRKSNTLSWAVAREAGGVTVTVVDDAMQRAPAFTFDSAREARDFGRWLDESFDEIKAHADATTGSGSLRDIQQFPASRMLYTRFNYTTGDAAGQNMTSKATAAACR